MIMGELKGLESISKNFGKKIAEVPKACERATVKGAGVIFQRSQYYVPVDKGNLKRSGNVKLVKKGVEAVAAITYSANYSIFVHENLDAAHGEVYNIKYAEEIKAGKMQMRGPQQRAKWLETAARETRKETLKAMHDELRKWRKV